jgi:hypothetical protein
VFLPESAPSADVIRPATIGSLPHGRSVPLSTRLAGGVMHHAGGAPGHRITTMIGQLDDGFSMELRRWTYCRIGPHPELPVKSALY